MSASPFRLKAEGSSSAPDLAEAGRALAVLADPAGWIQLQYMPFHKRSFGTFAGSDVAGMLAWVEREQPGKAGIYYTLNPVPPNLDHQINSSEIVRRRWLLIDVDRVKTKETLKLSATDEEHQASQALAASVLAYLANLGWPDPVVIDSGNGTHLLYRIDLPNDEPSRVLVKGCLDALAARFDGDRGAIGAECSDARRVAKLPGTWARKGPSSPDRPHRMARILELPDPVKVVTAEQLALPKAPESPPTPGAEKPPQKPPGANGSARGDPFNLKAPEGKRKAWAKAALEDECLVMAAKYAGELNNSLRDSAFRMGQLAGMGLLDEGEVFARLLAAGRSAGCDFPRKDEDTLRRAIKAGKANPREEHRMPHDDPPPEPEPQKPPTEPAGPRIYRMTDIIGMDLPEPSWAVPGILSEGLSILGGKPKLGKSWMALNLGLTIAAGGQALGAVPVVAGDVLYLSLEDRLRRVKSRAIKLCKGLEVEASPRLHVAVEWPRMHQGGLPPLKDWLERADRPALVIIDVWAKFRPPYRNGPLYDQDYEAGSKVKELADKFGVSLLILHHCKKAAAEDVVDEISGTLGLAGSADGILVLSRSRSENEGKLFITGRDVDEQELALSFDPKTCCWKSLGDAKGRAESRVKQKILDVFKRQPGSTYFPAEMAAAINENESTTRNAMWRMVQDSILKKVGNRYGWPVEDADAPWSSPG